MERQVIVLFLTLFDWSKPVSLLNTKHNQHQSKVEPMTGTGSWPHVDLFTRVTITSVWNVVVPVLKKVKLKSRKALWKSLCSHLLQDVVLIKNKDCFCVLKQLLMTCIVWWDQAVVCECLLPERNLVLSILAILFFVLDLKIQCSKVFIVTLLYIRGNWNALPLFWQYKYKNLSI